jgi:hypothetical protein
MASRYASINDLPILEADRKYHWALGRRPDNQAGLSDFGLLKVTGNPDENRFIGCIIGKRALVRIEI